MKLKKVGPTCYQTMALIGSNICTTNDLSETSKTTHGCIFIKPMMMRSASLRHAGLATFSTNRKRVGPESQSQSRNLSYTRL